MEKKLIIIKGKPNSCEGCHYKIDDLLCTLEEDCHCTSNEIYIEKEDVPLF